VQVVLAKVAGVVINFRIMLEPLLVKTKSSEDLRDTMVLIVTKRAEGYTKSSGVVVEVQTIMSYSI